MPNIKESSDDKLGKAERGVGVCKELHAVVKRMWIRVKALSPSTSALSQIKTEIQLYSSLCTRPRDCGGTTFGTSQSVED